MRGAPAATPGPGVPFFGALRARMRGQEGYGLIEVLVSALLVALIAVGVLSGFDSASATSGMERQRAVAAGLAQQDQEQLRALKASDLTTLSATPVDQTVGGTTYHVAHTATWVDDSVSGGSCSASSVAGFMKVTSTVTWDNMHVAPLALASLISPPLSALGPTEGSLTVNVTNAAGNGVSGATVTLSGAGTASGTTDSTGCAKWGLLPAGTYTVTVSKPGYVDPQGNATATATTSVVGSTTNAVGVSYDQAGTVTVQFDTKVAGKSTVLAPPTNPQFADLATASNGSTVVRGTFNTWVNAITFSLYPYSSPYTFYAGDCQGAVPNYGGNTGTLVTATVTPGSSQSVTVRAPNLDVTTKNNNTVTNGMHVVITQTDTGCTHKWSMTSGNYAMPGQSPSTDGQLPYQTFPYGATTVCVDNGTRHHTYPADNKSPNGIAVSANVANGDSLGVCT